MQVHASSQAMHIAPVSSAGDTIPVGAALVLSFIAVAVAIGQIRGCFLPSRLRPLQFAICCIFFASSASLLGVVFSRLHDNHRHQDAYLILVLFSSALPGMYEAEFFCKLLTTLYRVAQVVCATAIVLLFLLTVGLCIWLGKKTDQLEKTDELSLVLIPLLIAICGVYAGLSGGYSYLTLKLRKAKQSRFALWIFVANGFLCGFIPILAIILLGVGSAQVISVDLVLWILLASSSALTVRVPVFLWQKEFIKSAFGFTSQIEPHNSPLAVMADLSTRQNSNAELVPALHTSSQVETGTNAI